MAYAHNTSPRGICLLKGNQNPDSWFSTRVTSDMSWRHKQKKVVSENALPTVKLENQQIMNLLWNEPQEFYGTSS